MNLDPFPSHLRAKQSGGLTLDMLRKAKAILDANRMPPDPLFYTTYRWMRAGGWTPLMIANGLASGRIIKNGGGCFVIRGP